MDFNDGGLQSKRRDKKVYITDIAIKKVPYIEYKGFTEEQNKRMRNLIQEVLVLSKEKKQSNEVALTCDIGSDTDLESGISFGTEHEVDILADTWSNHLIMSNKSIAVVVLHNHPSTQTFSLQDIHFFIQFPMIKMIVVVSNQGTVHYLERNDPYDYESVSGLFMESIEGLDKKSSIKEQYFAALSFLARCSEVGLYYR